MTPQDRADADTLIDVSAFAPHEQGFRSAIGIFELVKRYGSERVDAACARPFAQRALYKSVAASRTVRQNNSSTQEAPSIH